jgi:hypothetical protein
MSVALPAKNTVQGAVARILLAEARDPGNSQYKAEDSKTAMQWMKVVLQNRLNNKPAQFMAPHAKTLIDIIKARGQFAGFSNYPNYSIKVSDRLQAILDIANAAKDQRSADYTVFVQNAIDVANSPTIADPSRAQYPNSKGLSAWRTAGTKSPGPRFSSYKDLAGNSFYLLVA